MFWKKSGSFSIFYLYLSLPFRICTKFIYHNYDVVYHLLPSSTANLLPDKSSRLSFLLESRASFSKQFLFIQWPSQSLFLFFISSNIILPSPTLSSTTAFFCLSILHASFFSLSTSQMLPICFCSFRRSVQVSAPYNATLHTKHSTSLFLSSFSKGPQKILFPVKSSF